VAGGPGPPAADPALRAAIRSAPKVELHLHLDGAMALPWLLERVLRRPAPPVRTLEGLAARLAFRDFDGFIRAWVWKCGFLDRYGDFESLAESVLTGLAAEGVVHVEPSVSPGDYARHGLEAAGVVEAVLRGGERARAATGIGWGLIVDVVRDHGPAAAAARLEAVAPYRGAGLVGLGLGGSEAAFPAGPFAEVFREAARRGLHRTAHAGEAAGPASVREALTALDAERIGHGVRASEDAALVADLARDGVTLEVCPTSNLRTGVVPGPAAHPLRRLFEAGVPVTVSSDDPTFFGVSLVDELALCVTALGFAPRDLATLTEHAARAAFLPGPEREALVARVRAGWAGIA
jgi:adenosine deaminase